MPDAIIEQPTDVLVKITATNICGSDLHMYQGRTDMESGRILGHENMGRVVEIGKAVTQIKVEIWFVFHSTLDAVTAAIGKRFNRFCLTMNPIRWCCLWFCRNGPYGGGQAEYLRVPHGDFNCLKLPEDAVEKQNDDYVMLSDVFPQDITQLNWLV
jgi:threonine dehydrogenase-like Zn-dependent dehydrogenase